MDPWYLLGTGRISSYVEASNVFCKHIDQGLISLSIHVYALAIPMCCCHLNEHEGGMEMTEGGAHQLISSEMHAGPSKHLSPGFSWRP